MSLVTDFDRTVEAMRKRIAESTAMFVDTNTLHEKTSEERETFLQIQAGGKSEDLIGLHNGIVVSQKGYFTEDENASPRDRANSYTFGWVSSLSYYDLRNICERLDTAERFSILGIEKWLAIALISEEKGRQNLDAAYE